MKAATYPAQRYGAQDERPACSLCNKIAFDDEAAAERSAARIRQHDRLRRADQGEMHAYYSDVCGWWHVGHNRKAR